VRNVPSVGVTRTDRRRRSRHILSVALVGVGAALVWASGAWASQLGTQMPGSCVAHTGFGELDVAGDYRCAGLVLRFHTSGVANAVSPIWAGQWLFTDPDGQYRVGTCTFNRGTHPTVRPPSRAVSQSFPNDPSGEKGSYLAWRYGDTTDPLTAAAVWAVFHHYALDPAGTNYSADPTAPLVPSLGDLAATTGRADLQSRALALDAEATAFRGPWNLSVSARADGVVSVTLLAGSTPVPDRPITVLVGGLDSSFEATTGTDGNATVTVPLPSGTVTVVATADAPGPVQVFRGAPASPNPYGAQPLVTGSSTGLRVETEVGIEEPSSTDVAPDTVPPTSVPDTVPADTDVPDTDVPGTGVPGAGAPDTAPPVTPSPGTAPSTSVVAAVADPEPTPSSEAVTPATHPPLPVTGPGGRGGIAQLATAFLVGGIGLLGTLRRPRDDEYTAEGDPR
jgi:hypothetical protein